MLNDENTQDGESLELEITADSESLESSQTTDDGEGEIGDSSLNLETSEPKVDKLTPAEENAQRQVDHWLLEVSSGRKKFEDAPNWVQKRMSPALEGKTPDIEQVVQSALEKERENQRFKELQATIPALTPSEAKELQERFNLLRPAGKVVALQNALDAMGLGSKLKQAEQRGIAKGRMSLPRSGQPSVKKSEQSIDGVPLKVITNDAEWNKMVKSQGQR